MTTPTPLQLLLDRHAALARDIAEIETGKEGHARSRLDGAHEDALTLLRDFATAVRPYAGAEPPPEVRDSLLEEARTALAAETEWSPAIRTSVPGFTLSSYLRTAESIGRNIVNQLADLWEVPVKLRQATNDRAWDFAGELVATYAAPSSVLAAVATLRADLDRSYPDRAPYDIPSTVADRLDSILEAHPVEPVVGAAQSDHYIRVEFDGRTGATYVGFICKAAPDAPCHMVCAQECETCDHERTQRVDYCNPGEFIGNGGEGPISQAEKQPVLMLPVTVSWNGDTYVWKVAS